MTSTTSINAIQGAAVIVMHSFVTKFLLSGSLRTYAFLESDKVKVAKAEASAVAQRAQKAQLNEAEYAALLAAPLLFLHLQGQTEPTLAATLATVGQVGYFWTRLVFGYPTVPAVTAAMVRYAGLFLTAKALWEMAF